MNECSLHNKALKMRRLEWMELGNLPVLAVVDFFLRPQKIILTTDKMPLLCHKIRVTLIGRIAPKNLGVCGTTLNRNSDGSLVFSDALNA